MITSFRNPLVKRIRRLRQKKHRQIEGAFFAEGLRVVLSAVESGAQIEALVYAPELLTSGVAWEMLAQQQAEGRPGVEVSAEVFASMSERDNPAGLGAIVRTPAIGLDSLAVRADDFLVALVDVSEPGNLGTIVRTADATGAGGVVLVGETVDPFHPTAVKASMGCLFSMPVVTADSVEELLAWARQRGLALVATSAHAQLSYWQADYHLPALVLFGSEGQGLDPVILGAADLSVVIPMAGAASSLNLAVAAGLLMYEMRRHFPLT